MTTDDKLKEMFNSLEGRFKHYCYDWDELPVDETCPEFECCSCFTEAPKKQREEVRRIQDEMREKRENLESLFQEKPPWEDEARRMHLRAKQTDRGFVKTEFSDSNNVECSIQESSLAGDEGFIWFGADSIGLKKFIPVEGWKDIDLNNEGPGGVNYVANTRMHLSQSQLKALLPILQFFAEHGELPFYELGDLKEENEDKST